jgi:photosystem II stability/assembly factor-like uncharacterized protein
MKKFINFTLIINSILLVLFSEVQAQPPKWAQLPNAPLAGSHGRFVDLYFVNTLIGYILRDGQGAFKTTNGGTNFTDISNNLASGGRSIGFFDANTGIVGMLNNNDTLIMRTTNGGNSWVKISNISGNIPRGICGISIVNSTTAFGTGRYYKPANLIKTTDQGLSWVSIPLDSTLITSAVDCHFWSADSGVVVGGFSENSFLIGNAVVIRTTNGGASFTRTHLSSVDSAWCWKVQFLNRNLGYASVESKTIVPYLKTTDGGATWTEKPFNNDIDQEGIGFINENTGWIGGWGGGGGMPTYETTDAGASWHLAGFGRILNRVRFLNDTLAYASGQSIYKFSKQTVGINQVSAEVPEKFSLSQNYPNPFNPSTIITYEVKISGKVKLTIFDNGGSEIHTLVNEDQSPGKYSISFEALHLASGIYYYTFSTNNFSETKKMVLVK